MGVIEIPIKSHRKEIGKLILEDVLIVPNLDRRLFSVSSFLSKGNNWTNFKRDQIELGVRNDPTIKLPITSLQANAFVVEHNTCKTKPKHYAKNNANNHKHIANKVVGHQKHKTNIDTNLLHDRFHRSDGGFATIRAHNLWRDVNITQGFNSNCASYKIMTTPATSRGKL